MIEKKSMKNKEYDEPKEFYNLNTWYSVTIAPSDEGQKWSCKVDRLKNFKKYWNELLSIYLQNDIQLLLFVECSQHGRLHWHGLIRFTQYEQIRVHYILGIPRIEKVGMLKIDRITNMNNWLNYCLKQQHIMMTEPYGNFYRLFPNEGQELSDDDKLINSKCFSLKKPSVVKPVKTNMLDTI